MVGGMTNNAKGKSQRKAPFFCLFGDPHLYEAFLIFAPPMGGDTTERLSFSNRTRPLTFSHNPE